MSARDSTEPLIRECHTVLIVDDTSANLALLSECLDYAGYQVAIATDGESALEKAMASPPSLILLDVIMPGMDGFEVCRWLKSTSITADVPVIFMTALSETSHKVRALKLGAVDYITKPFQMDEVLARVETHVSLRVLNQKLQAQNFRLSQEVQARLLVEQSIRVLNQSLQSQGDAVGNWQQASSQLFQIGQTASIGRLVAGVIHEMNQPIRFVHQSLNYTLDQMNQILTMLERSQKQISDSESVEVGLLKKNLLHLLQSMATEMTRIADLGESLQAFFQPDQTDRQMADIHTGLEQGLALLADRLKANERRPAIDVVKEYGQLEPIPCYLGQLNQVFMHILTNAIDALDEQTQPGQITIRTQQNDVATKIQFFDNGPGIPEEVRQRIFEPFFTTRTEERSGSKGTGMGLFISYQIITEMHGGKLSCNSVAGHGTQFTIELPSLLETTTD